MTRECFVLTPATLHSSKMLEPQAWRNKAQHQLKTEVGRKTQGKSWSYETFHSVGCRALQGHSRRSSDERTKKDHADTDASWVELKAGGQQPNYIVMLWSSMCQRQRPQERQLAFGFHLTLFWVTSLISFSCPSLTAWLVIIETLWIYFLFVFSSLSILTPKIISFSVMAFNDIYKLKILEFISQIPVSSLEPQFHTRK